MIKISVNQLDMWHIDCLKIFRKVSFDNLSAFNEVNSENDDFIINKFNWFFLFLIKFVRRLPSFAKVSIFYIDFSVFEEEFLKSIKKSFLFLLWSSFYIFEFFEEECMKLIMWVKRWCERVNCLFFSLFEFSLLNLILNLFLFEHDSVDDSIVIGFLLELNLL